MKSGSSRGFTLVELLVVLAIIGILTSVVLVSLSTVNSRGKDAAVQADLATVRTQAQFYYNSNSDYSPATATGSCAVAGTMFVTDATMKKAIAAADFANGGGATPNVFCNVSADGSAYAVSATLVSGGYFCVDSTGFGNKTLVAIGNNAFCTL